MSSQQRGWHGIHLQTSGEHKRIMFDCDFEKEATVISTRFIHWQDLNVVLWNGIEPLLSYSKGDTAQVERVSLLMVVMVLFCPIVLLY